MTESPRFRSVLPVAIAAFALLGSLAATLLLSSRADGALDRVLDERLRGAGESAALLLARPERTSRRLARLMSANALDGAYLLSRDLVVLEDAGGGGGQPADLLKVDPDRVHRAFAGEASVAKAYEVDGVQVVSGYFPVRAAGGAVTAVLALEAGQAFSRARVELVRARWTSIALSLLAALGLGLVVARWSATERARAREAQRAAHGEAVSRMAAMVAHEIRNPLGVIRGAIEVARERGRRGLPTDPQGTLEDILSEVDRMRRLTDDFLDLGAERELSVARFNLEEVVAAAARAAEQAHPEVKVRFDGSFPEVDADPGRLRQVFANLLSNAAQAQGAGELVVSCAREGGKVRVRVRDFGPGLAPENRARLFDPFFTTKAGGTGLGLAIARRLCERHGGQLLLADVDGPGAAFDVVLPVAEGREA